MFNKKEKVFSIIIFTTDILITVGAFLIAFWIRDSLASHFAAGRPPFGVHIKLLIMIIPLWGLLSMAFRTFDSLRTKTFLQAGFDIFKVILIGGLLIGFGVFFSRGVLVSRFVIFSFGILDFILLTAERFCIREYLAYRRSKGLDLINVLVVGTGKEAEEMARIIQNHRIWGLNLLGFVSLRPVHKSKELGGYPILGVKSNFITILHQNVVDEVIFASSKQDLAKMEELFLICEEEGVKTRVTLNAFPHLFARIYLEELQHIPLLTFSTTPNEEFALFIKRLMDIIISAVLLILLLPVLAIISILIKLESKGPVFFKQVRSGLNGRRFTLLKFRSMVADAEDMKRELLYLDETDGPVFKIANDPRVTKIGRFIRKTSIDELPQLINVLKGDMSLVGPRPPVPEEVERYERWQRRRLSMKPGITCIWQVSGRSAIGFKRWMDMDLEYIDKWSLGLDIKILLKTIPAVLSGKGAS
jgi:exopolysaccharide biosynthesis polyprenyl glycosylphosphotransferase